jgi:spore germination protein YaaH
MKKILYILPFLLLAIIFLSCSMFKPNKTNVFEDKNVGTWFFPGFDKLEENLKTTGKIGILNPQWGGISDNGQLVIDNDPSDGYSQANADLVNKYSDNQYINIVNLTGISSMRSLLQSPEKQSKFIQNSITWVKDNEFTGVEIDFELFWEWTEQDKAQYIEFLKNFSAQAHQQGVKVLVDLPAISSDILPSGLTYKEVDKTGVDGVTIMTYDAMYGEKPPFALQPLDWAKSVKDFAKSQFTNTEVTFGVPSYGYSSKAGEEIQKPETFSYLEARSKPGFKNAKRDNKSGELQWEKDGVFYSINDLESIQTKIKIFEGEKVMIWQLMDSPMTNL